MLPVIILLISWFVICPIISMGFCFLDASRVSGDSVLDLTFAEVFDGSARPPLFLVIGLGPLMVIIMGLFVSRHLFNSLGELTPRRILRLNKNENIQDKDEE